MAAIGALVRARGIPFLVDASQSAGAIPIDVQAMRIDLLAFPGHKGLLGPQGTGGLYVSEAVNLRPLKEGGTGSESNSAHQPLFYPDRLESGTLNLPGIAGLNESAHYLLRKGVETIALKEAMRTKRLLASLAKIEGVAVYGPPVELPRAPVVSFNLLGMDPVCSSRTGEAGRHCLPSRLALRRAGPSHARHARDRDRALQPRIVYHHD